MNTDMSTNDILDTIIDEIQFGLNGMQNNGNVINDFINTVYHIDSLSNMENGNANANSNANANVNSNANANANANVNATWEELMNLLPRQQTTTPSFQFTSELSSDFTDNIFSIPLYRHRNAFSFNLEETNNTLNNLINNTLVTDIKQTYKKVLSDEGKALLKRSTYHKNHHERDNSGVTICPIMQIPFEEGDEIIQLPCNHTFTAEHIVNWLENESAMCPVCRHELPSKEVKNEMEVASEVVSEANEHEVEGEVANEVEVSNEVEGEDEMVDEGESEMEDDSEINGVSEIHGETFNLRFDVTNNRFIADTPLQTNIINNLYDNVNSMVQSYQMDTSANIRNTNALNLIRNYININLDMLVENEIRNLNNNQFEELLSSELSNIINVNQDISGNSI